MFNLSSFQSIYCLQPVPASAKVTALTLLALTSSRADNDLAQAILVYRHVRSTIYLLSFNPVTGAMLSEEASPLELDQALMLPGLPQDNTRPLLLVGKDSSATVFPTSAISYLSTAPVYSYFNDKARRTELVSLEMYEGKEQGNATIFSIIENTVVSW